ncbi:protein kinase [Malassezia pachydermatis]|uniref:Protein kinase n=1 Tax=Malassezia pachydermatis TaxID=77020 RepID=A0A0M8MSQ1_9BASI|nr:protein kinase [Malassezia pachydermatis]KOS13574.1 protein kinase [Malassezia pachydermatis]
MWRRGESLFLGKDEERWASARKDQRGKEAWKFIKSVQSLDLNSSKDGSKTRYASVIGIPDGMVSGSMGGATPPSATQTSLSERRNSSLQLPGASKNAKSPPSPPLVSPNALLAQSVQASPSKVDASFMPSRDVALKQFMRDKAVLDEQIGDVPRFAKPTGEVKTLPDLEVKSPASVRIADSSVEQRRNRRLKLLQPAMKDHALTPRRGSPVLGMQKKEAYIPLYGNLEILTLVPKRSVEQVEGTLYLITTPDNRVFSAAKRRRWAMDDEGHFFAAMEIKSVESKLRSAKNEIRDPVYAKEYEMDLQMHYLDDILMELQKAESLVPGGMKTVPHVLQTEDGKIVRLEEDFPEEAFFVIAGCEDEELYPVIVRIFIDSVRLLWRLHSHGWMHGDIKLENLMFDKDKKLTIIDYENASPFRGSPYHDGKIQLLSFDWIPPELEVSVNGRRMGPSGDLWALGCNLIRAFALRDGISDIDIRRMLMGDGRDTFFQFRRSLMDLSDVMPCAPPIHYGINLTPLLHAADMEVDPPYMNPARLLRLFARRGPKLLQYVLAHSVTPSPKERNEKLGVQLAEEMLHDHDYARTWDIVDNALQQSLDNSGSAWVKPKLDEARAILAM